jgi:hypothetical protein
MTKTRLGRIDLRESVKRYSRTPPLPGLAAIAAASLCLGPFAAEAAGLSSWRAIKEAGLTETMLFQIKSGFNVTSNSGPSGQPLPLRIELPENPTASYSFLMFRNLPPQFRLSAGFGTKTYWAVSLNDVQDLQIIPPESYSGTLALEVLLIKTIGSDPERAVANVTFQPSANSGQLLTSTPPDGGITAALPSGTAGKSFDRIPSEASGSGGSTARQPRTIEEPLPNARMQPGRPAALTEADQAQMDRGDEYLRQGDVASARLIYRQLARRSIADGAYAMASTYDPEYLGSLGVRGLKPDVAEARKWYEKAHSLGSPLAAKRLGALGQR